MTHRPPTSLSAGAEAAGRAFAAAYGVAPEWVAQAPGRVNLIGEHTDYTGGLCLPLALPHRTFAAARRRDDTSLRLASAQMSESWTGDLATVTPDDVEGWPAYAVGVLAELRAAGLAVGGVEVMIDSAVPVGAGLSSSAALECAVAAAVLDGIPEADAPLVIEACIRAEGRWAGAPTGGLDQTIAVLARAGEALLIDFTGGQTRPVPLPLAEAGLALLVVDTRVTHALTDGGYAARRDQCAAAARALGRPLREATPDSVGMLADPVLRARARHVVGENARVLAAERALHERDWGRLGALLTDSHRSLRDDFEVSCAELDAVVETALGAGALGARMTGGGFGGSAIALLPQAQVPGAVAAVEGAFTERGWTEPDWLLAEPSAGAGRI